MARNKIGLVANGLEEYMEKLDRLGGSELMKRGVEVGLKESKTHINTNLNHLMDSSNLPRQGKYSTGKTKASIDTELSIDWSGLVGSINIGFDFSKSGLKSIFLMYGTPRQNPVKGLKDAIYGNKAQKEVAKLQDEALNKFINQIMES